MIDYYTIFDIVNCEIVDTKNKLMVADLVKISQLGTKQEDVFNLLLAAAADHSLVPDFFDTPASSAGKLFIDGKQGKRLVWEYYLL